ncbi:HU family DNA-binding protein [uncultured Bacteroides sp.]|uniref:HU family DNA-binding protein n=1 Tax=uncultured Bacteroides sp. TaxID=162156 RepID=UPI002609585E|nr:HU family DNA-binding protein [uncultured Bacteroides sp.]
MNEKLTIQDLIDLLAKRHAMEQTDADAFVKTFFALIEEALETDKYVKIKGLGTFKLIEVEARESIDVNTGERIEIQEHTRISFVPDSSMRDWVNKPFSHFETVVLNENTHFDDIPEDNLPETISADTLDDDFSEEAEEMEISEEPEPTSDNHTDADEKVLGAEEVIPEETEPDKETEAEDEVTEEEHPADTPSEEAKIEIEEADAEPKDSEDEERPSTDDTSVENTLTDDSQDANLQENTEEDKTQGIRSENKVPPVESSEEIDKDKNRERKPRLPWCMIAAVLFLGILLGGGIAWTILSGRRYIPKSVVEALLEQKDEERKAQAAADSIAALKSDAADSTATTVPNDSLQQNPSQTLPTSVPNNVSATQQQAVSVGQNQASKTNRSVQKRETLADTVQYEITGTIDTYTLGNGESLVKIALRYYGNKKLWPYLVKHNRDVISDPDGVLVGTTIRIPKLTPKTDKK